MLCNVVETVSDFSYPVVLLNAGDVCESFLT